MRQRSDYWTFRVTLDRLQRAVLTDRPQAFAGGKPTFSMFEVVVAMAKQFTHAMHSASMGLVRQHSASEAIKRDDLGMGEVPVKLAAEVCRAGGQQIILGDSGQRVPAIAELQQAMRRTDGEDRLRCTPLEPQRLADFA